MDRLKLASEAREVGRQFYASLPFSVRFAAAASFLVRLAFGDNATSVGLSVLHAMVERGVTGPVFESDMEEISEAFKKSRYSSKIYKVARSVGASVLDKGGASRLSNRPDVEDILVGKFQEKLLESRHSLKSGITYGQAKSYFNSVMKSAVKDAFKSSDYQNRVDVGESDDRPNGILDLIDAKSSDVPGRGADLNRVLLKIKSDKSLQAQDGRNLAHDFLTILSKDPGAALSEIARRIDVPRNTLLNYIKRNAKKIDRHLSPLLESYWQGTDSPQWAY